MSNKETIPLKPRPSKIELNNTIITQIDSQLSAEKEKLINSMNFQQSQDDIDKMAKNIKGDIKNLSVLIKSIIDKHHRDYILTFSSFMDTVRRDLKIKLEQMEKIEEEKRKVNDIKYIKCERDYFRIESIRMHNLSKELSTKIDDMSLRMKILTDEVNAVTMKWRESETINKQMAKELEQNVKAQKEIQNEMIQMKEFIQKTAEDNSYIQNTIRREEEKEENYKERSMVLVEKLKNELKKEKLRNHKLFTEMNNLLKEKSKIENIFIDCVEETRKSILNRRIKTKFDQRMVKSNSMKNINAIDTKYESFLPSDKRVILESFLFNDEISAIIKEALVLKPSKPTEPQNVTTNSIYKLNLPRAESTSNLRGKSMLNGFRSMKRSNMNNFIQGLNYKTFQLPKNLNH